MERSCRFFPSPLKAKSTLTTLAISFLTFFSFPSLAALTVQSGTPAGFESLAAPRPTSLKLYWGGEFLGHFSAQATPTQLAFDTPEEVLAAIPAIEDVGAVGAVLASPLPLNAKLVCMKGQKDGCGVLKPAIAGIIFDEARLSAELFIHPRYLSVQQDDSAKYLPLPEKRAFSSLYALSGAVAGTDGDTPNYSLTNEAIYAFGEAKFSTQSTMSNEGLRFDTAAASIDRRGWNATAGLFRSEAMQLMSDRDIAGVSFSTSSRTRLDAAKTQGNTILLFLPRRSFVSIYREGRLYSSKSYDAGNQEIDTAELPDGAYPITLKIQDTDGSTREETRFFAKTEEIPPEGEPRYFVQAGLIRADAQADDTLPRISGDPLVRAGVTQRVAENVGVTVSAAGVSDRLSMETGAFWIGEGVKVGATALVSTRRDFGVRLSYLQSFGLVNAAMDARKVWVRDEDMPGFGAQMRDLTELAGTLSYGLTDALTLGARGSYSAQAGTRASSSYGPYLQWRLWQYGESMLSLNADAAHTQNGRQGNVLVNFSHRLGGGFGISGNTGAGFGRDNSGPTGAMRLWHETVSPGETLRMSAGGTADRRNRSLGADAQWQNHIGAFRGAVQKNFGDFGSSYGYGGNFSVNAVQAEGDVHIGGDENARSAVVVATSGTAKGKMIIYVNEAEKSTVEIGDKQVLYLAPFHRYSIRLSPEKSALLDYESAPKRVTLYPGNVVRLEWDVAPFQVVAARIVRENGEAVTNAKLKESKTLVSTDDKGFVQAELSDVRKMTFQTEDGASCIVRPPRGVAAKNGVVVYEETLVCY